MTRVLIWVQHLLGGGHLQRMRLVAEALAARGAGVHFVTGGVAGPERLPLGVRVVELPSIKVADATFDPLLDATGRPIDDAFRAARAAALVHAFDAAQPHVVVLETWPFGRRKFGFEIEPLLSRVATRAPRPRVVASVRDLLQRRDAPAHDAAVWASARAHLDEILVHGDPAFARLEETFAPAADGTVPVTYTGYVVPGRPAAVTVPLEARQGVLVASGSGDVGRDLLAAAIAARPLSAHAALSWRLLAGPGMSGDAFEALVADGRRAGVVVERHRRDYGDLLSRARVSVSQAGYNTVQDVLAARTPAVLVPFAAAGETEQAMRAERLAARGMAEVVAERELAPAALAAAIDRAAARGLPPPSPFATDGAECSAARILALARDADRALR